MKFGNIVGYDNEKKELLNLRDMLHNAKEYKAKGVRIPKGCAIFGECGIGKTVLARSIADKGITLVELRAADCCSETTEESIRLAFEAAKQKTPSVLLLDELDKIAGTNMNFFMEGNDEVKKILLQELDGISEDEEVLVVATCNDLECLGEALLRPGRFDRLIGMSAPDEPTRKKILKKYFSKLSMPKEINYDYLAKITNGYTGAKLECLANEAGILVLREGQEAITEETIRVVMNKISFKGCEKPQTKNLEELYRIAVHEVGHAMVAMYTNPDKLFGASILPQGESGGHTLFMSCHDDAPCISSVENDVMVLLGGRVAERVILGEFGIGAGDDLIKAASTMMYLISNQAAYGYKYLYNIVANRGPINMSSDEVKNSAAKLLEEKLNELDAKAEKIIRDNMEKFRQIVNTILVKQVLCREELFDLGGVDDPAKERAKKIVSDRRQLKVC